MLFCIKNSIYIGKLFGETACNLICVALPKVTKASKATLTSSIKTANEHNPLWKSTTGLVCQQCPSKSKMLLLKIMPEGLI